jgi:hypothetical protein
VGAHGHVYTAQSLGGEDFAWYLESVPGAMARLGTRTPGGPTYDLHQGNMRIDERATAIGAKVLAVAAADALVHSTGGLTVLEAYIRGCPTISYGWGRGHIRANNAAFRRYGIAEVVAGRRELNQALRAALTSRPAPGMALGALPSAASLVLALVA